jgi:hypothetical protein
MVVGLVALRVQRTWGSKRLWVMWLAPAVMYTSFLLTQIDYTDHTLLSRLVLQFALANFGLVSILSGIVVWHTVVWFGPRLLATTANGRPAGPLEDVRGLMGILGRYEKLLMGQVPNILALDLTGAEAVLAELETLTPAQLSAIEACHHMNVRRLRQRSILGWGWRSKLAGLIGVIGSLVLAAEHVGVLKFKDIDLWLFISGITLMGLDMSSILARSIITGVVCVVMLFIANGIYFLPILRRLQAFEDILTITKAYRKGQAETPEFTAQKASVEDPDRIWTEA